MDAWRSWRSKTGPSVYPSQLLFDNDKKKCKGQLWMPSVKYTNLKFSALSDLLHLYLGMEYYIVNVSWCLSNCLHWRLCIVPSDFEQFPCPYASPNKNLLELDVDVQKTTAITICVQIKHKFLNICQHIHIYWCFKKAKV